MSSPVQMMRKMKLGLTHSSLSAFFTHPYSLRVTNLKYFKRSAKFIKARASCNSSRFDVAC